MKPPLPEPIKAPLKAAAKPIVAVLELVPEGVLPGLVLLAAAAAALIVANGPLGPAYDAIWHRNLGPLTLHGWINDVAMALFFFQVGLELKRELVEGDLDTAEARRIPLVAAAAGMATPALIYLAIVGGEPDLRRGWAIPAATDIAFALGVLALLGKRVPASLRLLLVTIAIADDMGAVAIIALAYTTALNWPALALAALILAGLLAVNRRGIRSLWPFAGLGIALWLAVHASGVHATVAGVLVAVFVPLGEGERRGPLENGERALAPFVSYAVLPVFAFANAGVRIEPGALLAPLTLAVAAGLFVGKQAGIFIALRIMAALGIGHRPEGTRWLHLYGMALLAGIGFTMSLFIGGLAFADARAVAALKAGVLGGSLLSAIAGYVVLRIASRGTRDGLGRDA